MILSPFEAIPCIEIDDINHLTTGKELVDKSMSLTNPIAKKFVDFYNTERCNRYGFDGILPAEYTHEYNLIKNEWGRKVITVGVGDDIVIVTIKHIQMFQHVYERMDGLPISVEGNRKHEDQVFDALMGSGLTKKVLANDQEGQWIESKKNLKVSSEWQTYNYITDVAKRTDEVESSKWKSKNRINTLISNPLLTYRLVTEQEQCMKSMSDAFFLWKKDIEKSRWLVKGLSKAFVKYPYPNDESIDCVVFEYDGFPIGWYVNLVINNTFAHEIIEQSVVHMKFEDKNTQQIIADIPNNVKKRLGRYMHYIKIKRLRKRGVDASFAGCVSSTRNSDLNLYKMDTTSECCGAKIYEND